MPIQSAMRAAVAEQMGVLPQIRSVPVPTPKAGEALIRIRASGVNPLDLKILADQAKHARHPLPAILGLDLAGTIVAIDPSVRNVKIGDDVYGLTGGVGGLQGSLAEYAAVDASLLAVRPERLTAREAAALPLVAITAWEGLVDHAHVGKDHTVLVHGGAGGVGHIAVQIARAFGAEVFATGSAVNQAYIEQLGATFIDYRHEAVQEYVLRLVDGRGFDIVYDTVGGITLDASFSAVCRGGHVISCLGWGTHSLAPLSFRAASYSGVFSLLPLLTGQGRSHHGDILRAAAQLVADGRLIPRVDRREFSLDSLAEAYRLIEQRSARGKIVIDIGQ
jgi:NADPH:quinone reductase